jgi:hypothetical protein
MRLTIVAIIAAATTAFALQRGPQTPTTDPIRVRGCLSGSGSKESPWVLKGAVLPAPPAAAPAGGRGGAGGGGGAPGGGGAAGAGGAGRGGGRGGDGGGRGGDGAGRGAAPPAAAPAPPPQPPVDLQLTDIDMTPWRNMFVEVEGTLGPRPATGLREVKVSTARSAYGDCK